MRRWRLSFAFLVALGLFIAAGPRLASAGTNGQYLALRDVVGNDNSAIVGGDNQSCHLTYYYINNWPQHDFDISGYWWQSWSGCSPYYTTEVWTYSGTNQTGTQNGTYGLNGPPHSQSNTWWTCEVDGGSACATGQNAFG